MDVLNKKTKSFKVAVLGGGTGSFTLLNGFKKYDFKLSAIVNMADDGSSTGTLRDELGVLPPGDVRRCLVALSKSPKIRDLFEYRFAEGSLKGHAFGNLLLAALEKVTGSFTDAVETASEILNISGTVIPATLNDVRLALTWPDKNFQLFGEKIIDIKNFPYDPRLATLSLIPRATANPKAIQAIEHADMVVIAPGDLYTSLGPILVIEGISEALKSTNAKIIYVCNLATKRGQTDGFDVRNHSDEIERLIGAPVLDVVLYNTGKPQSALLERYAREGDYWVEINNTRLADAPFKAIPGDLVARDIETTYPSSDPLIGHRTYMRHNADKVAKVLLTVVSRHQ